MAHKRDIKIRAADADDLLREYGHGPVVDYGPALKDADRVLKRMYPKRRV